MRRPARTGTLGRTGRLRAAQATASASTSRSTRNFTMGPSGRSGTDWSATVRWEVNPAMQPRRAGGSVLFLLRPGVTWMPVSGGCPQEVGRMDVDGCLGDLEVRRSHSNGGNCGELRFVQVRWASRRAQGLWNHTDPVVVGCGPP